jgi:DNA invertase Pin-like site-specific DNA recombinase
MATLLLSVLGAFVEFERALIRETSAGGHRAGQGPRRLHGQETIPYFGPGRGPAGPRCSR